MKPPLRRHPHICVLLPSVCRTVVARLALATPPALTHEATHEGPHGVLDRADGIGGLAHQAEREAIGEGEDRLGWQEG